MANISIWSGVGVTVESARGAALPITTPFISKASPGVLTSTAHGLSNGDFVIVIPIGMGQVNGRVFRVANKGTDNFQLEGEDTTLYDSCTGGNAYKITFGTVLDTLTSISASGGDFDYIDTTTIHDLYKSQIPGQSSPSTYTFDSIWDVADAGLVALKAASDNKAQKCIKFTFANAQKLVFAGYIGASLSPTGSAGDKVTTPVAITAFGRPTSYAT